MRFADFVLADIAKNGAQFSQEFMGDVYLVDSRRTFWAADYANGPETQTCWGLWVSRGIWPTAPHFRRAYLIAGKNRHRIDLTVHEHKRLCEAWDECWLAEKRYAKRLKLEKEAKRQGAAWVDNPEQILMVNE